MADTTVNRATKRPQPGFGQVFRPSAVTDVGPMKKQTESMVSYYSCKASLPILLSCEKMVTAGNKISYLRLCRRGA